MDDQLIQVRLREGRKPKRFLLSSEFDAGAGDWVVVPVEEDEDFGVITGKPIPVPPEWEGAELPSVSDLPNEEEVHKAVELRRAKEPEALKHAYPKVREHKLDMKLVSAFYYYRPNKMKFYFSSENRVDFRELVKDLAHLFHARIEMRQIGVRDAAGLVGGYGLCGQELCCSRFLKGFDPITIKMAKDQNLALNPSKISGCCGRLLCCLKYEHATYTDAQKQYPRLGASGRFGDRVLKVVSYNILKETIGLQVDNQILEIPLDEFKDQNPDWRNAPRYSPAMAMMTAEPGSIHPVKAEAVAEEVLEALDEAGQDAPELEGSPHAERSQDSASGQKSRRRRRRGRGKNPGDTGAAHAE
jgi:cell fate regulator YaaT (PSP1 superfamily)